VPTVTVSQIQSDPMAPLDSPLSRDAIITLRWSVEDVPNGQSVGTQECTLLLEADHGITAQVDSASRNYSFRLSKGTLLSTLPLRARVRVNLTAQAAGAAIPPLTSANANIEFASMLTPEREAMTAVYSELNQELRRTRTLYESFLVVVTGGIATLYAKADAIVGASHRDWMGFGVMFLALIVIYMLWHIAERYAMTTKYTNNLECALGLRQATAPAVIMPSGTPWWPLGPKRRALWEPQARPHTAWALMLSVYTLLLAGLAGADLVESNQKAASTPPALTQSTNCDCVRLQPCNPAASANGSPAVAQPPTSAPAKSAAKSKPVSKNP
jgi:hypothetical protein